MKTTVFLACILFGITTLFIHGCKSTPEIKLKEELFMNPPDSSSIHAWWHWLDNSITKEGITKDLEAMKKQGISTVTILNIGLLGEKDMGVPQIKFNTPEWFGMFEWALHEANRLGMKVGAHNCDGWSSSGGPWITPETSMKRCTWCKSVITGGQQIEIKLPEPKGNLDFYRDISVLAFPANDAPSSFLIAKPEISVNDSQTGDLLYDGNPLSSATVKSGTKIDFRFSKNFMAEKLAINPHKEFDWGGLKNIHYQVELSTSPDGKSYKKVFQFEGPAMNKTTLITIPSTNAKYYRLEFKNVTGTESGEFGMGETELLKKEEKPAYSTAIPFHLEKTITTQADGIQDLLKSGKDSSAAVSLKDIIDITQYMSPDGTLKWDAPAGNWEILRVGYTTTGAQNGPATRAGTGLECDKMDTSALNLHFKNFPEKLIAHAGKFTGNTFEYLFVDSWECRYQNWTANFASEFEKRRHYSIEKWLPVICGVEIDNQRATEQFLQDFRKTIAELIEENYYKHFNELCHRNGVKSHVEVIYGGTGYPPLDILKSNSYVDVPMFEFWAGPDKKTGFVKYYPSARSNWEIPVQAGALYGKKIIPAESFTGYANYSETPWDLKLYGDRAFCSGINQIVLHSYIHQPFEKKPGVTLGIYGQSFNRHNPWWNFASQWFTYLAREQYILQQGTPVADILYFEGDRYYDEFNDSGKNDVPYGYSVQKCNLDILLNHCTVQNGKLQLDNGLSYGMLLIPDDTVMDFSTLKRISELVKEGAVVSGPKPLKVAGNFNSAENDKKLSVLSGEMWGNSGNVKTENSYGKGKVMNGSSLAEILKNLQIKPDFSCDSIQATHLLYIHKKIGDTDAYFVVNQENKTVERKCTFRISGKSPEIWDPEYGTVSRPADYTVNGEMTSVNLKFGPKESLFFVFRNEKSNDLPVRQTFAGKYILKDCPGTLEFQDLPAKQVIPVTQFGSWTNNPDPQIKYYSGSVLYRLNFNLPAEQAARKSVFLGLDSVMVAYKITLNGKYLGCSTFPGHRFDVSGLLKEQGNSLEIQVANTWRNRIIGDFNEFGKLTNCWTTSPVNNLPKKEQALQESGMLGPAALYFEK